jgi:hypothetical protein
MTASSKLRRSRTFCSPVRTGAVVRVLRASPARATLARQLLRGSAPARALFNQLRFDANYFRRYVNNYADDDQIINTAISFPIAFRKAIIYGAEGKLEVPHWNRFPAFSVIPTSWATPGSPSLEDFSRRRCRQRHHAAHRTFSRFAGSAQHRPPAHSLSTDLAAVDCRRRRIRQRLAL